MADRSRIPTTIAAFNDYIVNGDDRLQAINPDTGNPYFKDYGIDPAVATSWSTQRKNWVTNVYAAYSNPATSTSIAKDNVKTFMQAFRDFATPVLNKIEVSDVAGNAEEHIFNFVLHRKNPTRPTAPIDKECFANLHGMGRGLYEMVCRSAQDASRAGKVHGADSVQFSYTIVAQQPATPPAPDDAGMSHDLSTTALFQHDFGAANVTKWLLIYFRWYNTKHVALAGPWSAMQSVAIS